MAERRSVDKDGVVTMELDVADTACGLCHAPIGVCPHKQEERLRYVGLLVLAQPYFDRLERWWRSWKKRR